MTVTSLDAHDTSLRCTASRPSRLEGTYIKKRLSGNPIISIDLHEY